MQNQTNAVVLNREKPTTSDSNISRRMLFMTRMYMDCRAVLTQVSLHAFGHAQAPAGANSIGPRGRQFDLPVPASINTQALHRTKRTKSSYPCPYAADNSDTLQLHLQLLLFILDRMTADHTGAAPSSKVHGKHPFPELGSPAWFMTNTSAAMRLFDMGSFQSSTAFPTSSSVR